jgi:acetyltransferase-like isoleucine patch superfamily enzyme
VANPTITNYGGITYTNNENNWRSEDVAFLQRRAVLRFPTQASIATLTAEHAETGAVAYIAEDTNSDDDIEPGADPHFVGYHSASLGWRRMVSSNNLRIPAASDLSTSVRLRHASASGGLTLGSSGTVVVDSRLEVSTGASIENGVLTLGGSTLQTTSGKLTSNVTLRGSTLESAGAITGVSLTTTGAVTVGNGLTVTAGGLTVSSGGVTVTGTVTATTVSATTVTGTTVTNGSVSLSGSQLISSGRYVEVATGGIKVFTSSNSFQFRDTSAQTWANVAGWVASTSPASGTYPNGTIWFELEP